MPDAILRSTVIRRDPGQVGASLDKLGDQLNDGWKQAAKLRVPTTWQRLTKVAVCGMGGSHLGPDILRSVYADQLPVPVTIIADYRLPAWVDENTLVVCSSYSGSTEETMEALKTAVRRRAKVLVMATGGALAKAAGMYHLPLFRYEPKANPSGQPRLGTAYGMMGLLAVWKQLGWIRVPASLPGQLATVAERATRRFGPDRPMASNAAKQLAYAWRKKTPLLIGAEWTAGNLHTFVNQIHENAKTFATWYLLPDLDHHLLEGLRNRAVGRTLSALFIDDANYHPRTQRRLILTRRILGDQSITALTFRSRGKDRLAQAIELLAFGGYVSWYLAGLRNVKPAPIPTVDYLKAQLARR